MSQVEPLTLARDAIVAGKYRLIAPLASGGMGAVWTAIHVELGVRVAIKFIDPEQASSDVARVRFAREAMSAAALHHPNIVDVRDYGVDRGTPYLVMELLRGESLSSRLRREGRLSLRATSSILSQIARALRVAHEAGVVHRDLKPGNIFLARVDADEEVVKVLDFGIAKDVRAGSLGDVTRTGDMVGSPHYMSPEQVRGAHDLDSRSDIWSLGVIVFRCLTGRLPFPGDVLGDVIAKIVSDPIPHATALAPDLPPPIDSFLACAMARDRAARFPAVREMAAALSAIASGPPAAPMSSPSLPASSSVVSAVPPVSSPSSAGSSAVAGAVPSGSSPSSPGSSAVVGAVPPGSSPSFPGSSAAAMALSPADQDALVSTSVLWPAVPGEATSGTLDGAGRSTAPRGTGRGRSAALVVALLGCLAAATIGWLRRTAETEGAPAAAVVTSVVLAELGPAPVVAPRPADDPPTPSALPLGSELPPAPALPAPSALPSASASASAPTKASPSPRRTPAPKKNGLPAVGF